MFCFVRRPASPLVALGEPLHRVLAEAHHLGAPLQRRAERSGERHPLDVFSLLTGGLFCALAGLFALDDLTSVEVEASWAAPTVLLLLGGAGLLASLRR